MPRIFEYIDYRAFLAEWCRERKASVPGFSFRSLNDRASIKSPNFLQQVIAGRRNLTPAVTQRLCRAMRLGRQEALFLRKLVLFNQASDAAEKQEHYAVIVSMMNSVEEHRLTAQQCEYYGAWYHSVIRELVCLHDFRDDYAAIASAVRPAIKPQEAQRAIEVLVRLKLLVRDGDGGYRQSDAAIVGGGGLLSLAVRNLNRQMLLKACEALDGIPREDRHISGITAGVSRAGFDLVIAEIQAFRNRLVSIINRDRGLDRVCQINLQFFPLSRVVAPQSVQKGCEP